MFYIFGARSFENREEFLVEFGENISVMPEMTDCILRNNTVLFNDNYLS